VIRSTLKRIARRMLRREPAPASAASRPAPATAPGEQSPEEPTNEKPWYLDGETETWGWENTNAQEAEEEDG